MRTHVAPRVDHGSVYNIQITKVDSSMLQFSAGKGRSHLSACVLVCSFVKGPHHRKFLHQSDVRVPVNTILMISLRSAQNTSSSFFWPNRRAQ